MLSLPEPQHYPIDLSRYGTNPHGKPLYRVVFAPSVKKIVGGLWPDGRVEYRLRPAYRHLGEEWILEKWLSAFEATKLTKEQYEDQRITGCGLYLDGPYPMQGLYFIVGDAPLTDPGQGGFEKLIGWVEKGKNNDPIKNALAINEEMKRREDATDATMLAKIQETRPAFGARPTSFRGHVHSVKSKTFDHAAPSFLPKSGFGTIKEK